MPLPGRKVPVISWLGMSSVTSEMKLGRLYLSIAEGADALGQGLVLEEATAKGLAACARADHALRYMDTALLEPLTQRLSAVREALIRLQTLQSEMRGESSATASIMS